MRYLKKFEKIKSGWITKNGFRPINVGDKVIWTGYNRRDFANSYTEAESRQANKGDICEITKLKTIKGELFAKAINSETQEPICSFFDASRTNRMPYNPEGHWWEFDTHFKHEEDSIYTPIRNKFNL